MLATTTSTAPDTSQPPVAATQGLLDWPAKTDDAAPIPSLLPAVSPAAGAAAIRFELNEQTRTHRYTQVWLANDGASFLMVTTLVGEGPTTPAESRTPVDVADWTNGWAEGFTVRTHPQYVNLQLVDPGLGYVQVRGYSMDRAAVLAIASTLQRRPAPEPGWIVPDLPTGLEPFSEGGNTPISMRKVVWSDVIPNIVAELTVASNVPDLFESGLFLDAESSMAVNINGNPGVIVEYDGRVEVAWAFDEQVQARLGFNGTTAEAIAVAQDVREVDLATLEANTELPGDRFANACSSFFC